MNTQINAKGKIETLQALRCIAMLCVVLQHIGSADFLRMYIGGLGVSIFLVLSGFTMTYSYYQNGRIKTVSLKDNIEFARNKISRLYPLHMVATFACFAFLLIGENATVSITTDMVKLALNAFLIHAYIPLSDRNINGASWFLCVMVLFYFIFPYVIRRMDAQWSTRLARIMIFGSVLGMVLLGVAGHMLGGVSVESLGDSIWDTDLTRWFVREFPISCTLEIWIGCNLGYLFIEEGPYNNNSSYTKYTIMEAVAITLSFAALVICKLTTQFYVIDGRIVVRPYMWWQHSLVWIVGSVLLVWSFARGQGAISRVLVNSFTLYIARISPYVFLIHIVVFRYIYALEYRIPWIKDSRLFIKKYHSWICVFIGIPVTIVACEIWIRLERIVKNTIQRRSVKSI